MHTLQVPAASACAAGWRPGQLPLFPARPRRAALTNCRRGGWGVLRAALGVPVLAAKTGWRNFCHCWPFRPLRALCAALLARRAER